MKEMSTLNVNGQSYRVKDSEAVTHTPQSLSDDQKAQARANIDALGGTATIENGVLVVSAASIENNILIME